jgi:alkylation response protein AidB-like acyl-CoA dehydrogenase
MEILSAHPVPEHARAVKATAREFAEQHIAPVAADYYESGEYPWEVLEAGMEAGLVGQDLSEEFGGKGYDLEQVLAIAEEFFRADAGIALTLQLASFGAEIVEDHGSEAQKKEYLRPIAENEQITGLAVSEPETGSDLTGMTTSAEAQGDEWVLNGEKYWVGNAVEADWLTLYAKTGDDPNNRYDNYSMFIVPTDAEGYDAEHVPEKMGFRASKQGHIVLDNCRIPKDHLIGVEGAGFYMLAEFFNRGRVVVGGHGLGLAAAAIEEAWEFVHDREAFGRTINEFQAVQHKLSDMQLQFQSARSLTWDAARRVANQEDAGYWAALAKTAGTEAATECAQKGMQLFGGRSVLLENRLSRVFRDARVPVIYEGPNDIQRNLIYRQTPQ